MDLICFALGPQRTSYTWKLMESSRFTAPSRKFLSTWKRILLWINMLWKSSICMKMVLVCSPPGPPGPFVIHSQLCKIQCTIRKALAALCEWSITRGSDSAWSPCCDENWLAPEPNFCVQWQCLMSNSQPELSIHRFCRQLCQGSKWSIWDRAYGRVLWFRIPRITCALVLLER